MPGSPSIAKDVSLINAESEEIKTKSPHMTRAQLAAAESQDASSSRSPKSKKSSESLRPELGDDDVENSDDAKIEADKDHAEILRRKRDREGSLEPSISSQTTPSDLVPSKKNRLQDAAIKEEQASASSSAAPATAAQPSSPSLRGAEGEKVGQIRKRVQDLSWKQRKEGNRDGQEEDDDAQNSDVQAPSKTEEDNGESPAIIEEEAKPKRSQPSFSSFSTKSSGFAAASAAKDNGASFLSSPTSQQTNEKRGSASPNANRSQPTFSSFSKSSSPFSTASNVAGPSWLAGKTDGVVTSASLSSGATGGIRPSALGTVASPLPHSSKSAQVVTTSAETPPRQEQVKTSSSATGGSSDGKKQLGFGAFSSSKTFTSSREDTPASATEKLANGDTKTEKKKDAKTFDEVLQQEQEGKEAVQESGKVSTQFESGQVDLRTGEEDEKTLTSARAKLYTMSDDKNWKERGTGTVRCNIAKKAGGTARLVMRSEGVYRLILNVNLFKGMKINLEQDKFLRIVALEEDKLAHFAIKFANAATASTFYRVIKQTIPVEVGDEWA